MADLTITIQGADVLARRLGAVSDGLAGATLRTATLAGAQLVVNRAQELAPVRTGTLRRSLHAEVIESTRLACVVQVGTDVSYARMMEEGTRPHLIEPKVKKALWWKGAAHPVAAVHHPGTAPRPFLVPALAEKASAVEAEILTAIQLLLDAG